MHEAERTGSSRDRESQHTSIPLGLSLAPARNSNLQYESTSLVTTIARRKSSMFTKFEPLILFGAGYQRLFQTRESVACKFTKLLMSEATRQLPRVSPFAFPSCSWLQLVLFTDSRSWTVRDGHAAWGRQRAGRTIQKGSHCPWPGKGHCWLPLRRSLPSNSFHLTTPGVRRWAWGATRQ